MLADPRETIVALSSAAGPGARAIVRLSGPDALRVAATVFVPAEVLFPTRRRRFEGHLRLPGVAAPLPADFYSWPAPRSYTGQELVELHTLSSPPLIEVLVAQLLRGG